MKLRLSLLSLIFIIAISCSEEEPEPQTQIEIANFEATIDENPEQGAVLGVVQVTNSTGVVNFTLGNENPEGALSINSIGEIIVADASLFNFEANPVITAEVTATDDNSNDTGTITINLNNVDESDLFTIWDGPDLTFTKADGTDPSLAENQDRITNDVWITRGTSGGQIYNALQESSATQSSSPAGTKWALGTVDNIEALVFNSFREAVGSPRDVVGKDLVLYLETEDVYLKVKFSAWSQGSTDGGGFSYTRATESN